MMSVAGGTFRVTRLRWSDVELEGVELPVRRLALTLGLGSGLARRAGDRAGVVWAITDRGPNLHVSSAIDDYGLAHLEALRDLDGAKIMPWPERGPEIVELRVEDDRVRAVRRLPLVGRSGRRLSALPVTEDAAGEMERVFDVEGAALGVDATGADTEGLVALSDGSFWAAEEYGPSLLKIGADGQVLVRWVPAGREEAMHTSEYDVRGVLPAIASRRRLNRGFEGLAISPDERWLYVAFQSALVHAPGGRKAGKRIARIWKLDAGTGAVVSQYLYPFDAPGTFLRDAARGDVDRGDLKICEIVAVGRDRLIVLERMSHSARLYMAHLDDMSATPAAHVDVARAPSLEEMDADGFRAAGIRVLEKLLLLSSDALTEIGPDIEGVAVLSATEFLLVSDNDFGVEGARTGFWRVTLDAPLFDLPQGMPS